MTDTAQKMYEHFKTQKQYNYSEDSSIKYLEIQAIDELESSGYIIVKSRALGFVIADAL